MRVLTQFTLLTALASFCVALPVHSVRADSPATPEVTPTQALPATQEILNSVAITPPAPETPHAIVAQSPAVADDNTQFTVQLQPTSPPSLLVPPQDSAAASGSPAHPAKSAITHPAPSPFTTLNAALTLALGLSGALLYLCGLSPAKHCGYTVTLILLTTFAGFLGFWACGFALASGGIGDEKAGNVYIANPATYSESLNREIGFTVSDHFFGIMGNDGFFVTGTSSVASVASLFIIQFALFLPALVGITSAALGRVRLLPFSLCIVALMAFILPYLANWIWGGGWLVQLANTSLSRGAVDFAGSSVVHLAAGCCALSLLLVLGRNPTVPKRPRTGHNSPLFITGATLILASFFSANLLAASITSSDPDSANLGLLNTLLGATGALLLNLVLQWWENRGIINPYPLAQALIAGAVSVSAFSNGYDGPCALLIGMIAGFLAHVADVLLSNLRIDDPASTIATQGVAGLWGTLAVGLFANTASSVPGLIYTGQTQQLVAQLITVFAAILISFLPSLILFWIVEQAIGLHVEPADREAGLDMPHTGVPGYQADE